jgi:hypothetical protein
VDFNHRHIEYSLSETDVEFEGALSHTEVQWLSHGTGLKLFFLRLQIEMFMNVKGKVVAVLSDRKCFFLFRIATSHKPPLK